MLRIGLTPESKKRVEFLVSAELKKRIEAISRITARKLSKEVLEDILKSLPEGTEDEKAYKKALKLADIEGQPAVAITGFVKKDLATVNATTTLAFFPTRGTKVRDPASTVLARYEPWATYALPPITYLGPMVLRTVSAPEVLAVAARNTAMRPAADKMLKSVGVRFGSRFEHKGEAFFDLENFGLRMEFGLPGVTTRAPHWQQPLQAALRGVHAKRLASDEGFQELVQGALLEPNARLWKAEDRPLGREIAEGEAKGFEDFQDRVL